MDSQGLRDSQFFKASRFIKYFEGFCVLIVRIIRRKKPIVKF